MCFHVQVNRQDTRTADATPICRVRRREASDLDGCVGVLAEVHDHDGYPVNWPARPGEWLTQPSLIAAWVAELNGRLVGHIGLSRSSQGDVAPVLWSRRDDVPVGQTAVISRLFVSPSARGHGVGALLMARAAREAQEGGLHPVLDVVASDVSAAALYERLGWSLLGTVDQQWSPTQTVTVHCYAAPVRSDTH